MSCHGTRQHLTHSKPRTSGHGGVHRDVRRPAQDGGPSAAQRLPGAGAPATPRLLLRLLGHRHRRGARGRHAGAWNACVEGRWSRVLVVCGACTEEWPLSSLLSIDYFTDLPTHAHGTHTKNRRWRWMGCTTRRWRSTSATPRSPSSPTGRCPASASSSSGACVYLHSHLLTSRRIMVRHPNERTTRPTIIIPYAHHYTTQLPLRRAVPHHHGHGRRARPRAPQDRGGALRELQVWRREREGGREAQNDGLVGRRDRSDPCQIQWIS